MNVRDGLMIITNAHYALCSAPDLLDDVRRCQVARIPCDGLLRSILS
jgi:hypothetical protein